MMKAVTSLTFALAAVVVATALLEAQNEVAAAPKGSAEHGKKVFASHGCYQCHGYAAQGGGAGPRLAPRPIAFTAFSRYVRLPTRQMPPYTSKVLSDQELADVYAFLSSIPPAPAANTIPLLSR
jgi:mono/diheme cytochrome c family protein